MQMVCGFVCGFFPQYVFARSLFAKAAYESSMGDLARAQGKKIVLSILLLGLSIGVLQFDARMVLWGYLVAIASFWLSPYILREHHGSR